MRRILIGVGTSLGNYLACHGLFSECFTFKQALTGLSHCDEAIVVAPSGKRLASGNLGQHGESLIASVSAAARRLVLLSSIDVYPGKGLPFDETAFPTGANGNLFLAMLERKAMESGSQAAIVRLPDVFGPSMTRGLAGRLSDRDASGINRVAIHQWYPVRCLETDLDVVRDIGAPIVNLCPEPLPMTAVLDELFPAQVGHVLTPAPYSRIRTRYAEAFGGAAGYIMGAEEVLDEMSRHVRAVRRHALTASIDPAVKRTAAHTFAEARS